MKRVWTGTLRRSNTCVPLGEIPSVPRDTHKIIDFKTALGGRDSLFEWARRVCRNEHELEGRHLSTRLRPNDKASLERESGSRVERKVGALLIAGAC